MHKHHIVPKHRDRNSTATVEVTVTQHAMFHYCEWKLHGFREDWLAWKSLTKQIGNEEIWMERSAIGGKNNAGKPKSAEHRAKLSEANQGWKLSPEAKERHSKSMLGNKNSQVMKTAEARARHSEIMKAAWARRKSSQTT
jgi:hypothetical protein